MKSIRIKLPRTLPGLNSIMKLLDTYCAEDESNRLNSSNELIYRKKCHFILYWERYPIFPIFFKKWNSTSRNSWPISPFTTCSSVIFPTIQKVIPLWQVFNRNEHFKLILNAMAFLQNSYFNASFEKNNQKCRSV